jgi:hypothetical protein
MRQAANIGLQSGTVRLSNMLMQPTGFSMNVIVNLRGGGVVSRRLIRALGSIYINHCC